MNPGVTVLSSHEITPEELKDVLLKAGGIYDPGGGAFGLIGQGEQYIWIYTNEDSLQRDTAGFLNMLKHDQPDVLEEIQTKLGGGAEDLFRDSDKTNPGKPAIGTRFCD